MTLKIVRHFAVTFVLPVVRTTQLYRTLPHEVGHYVDYLEKVEIPGRDDIDKWSALNHKYHSRPETEKDTFAHRYADDFRISQHNRKTLPFDRILDKAKMMHQGLRPEWFD